MAGVGGVAGAGRAPGDGNLFENGDFEDGTTAWSSHGGGSIEAVDDPSRSGLALRVSGRTETWQGPQQSILDDVNLGETIDGGVVVSRNGMPDGLHVPQRRQRTFVGTLVRFGF